MLAPVSPSMFIFMSQRKVPNHVTQVPSGPLERGRGAAEAGHCVAGAPGLGWEVGEA